MRQTTFFRWASVWILLSACGCAARRDLPVVTASNAAAPSLTAAVASAIAPATPTPSPTATASPTATVPAKKRADRPVTLAFVGDIMMGGSALPKLRKSGPDSYFTHVKDLLAQADACVGNLEGPLGDEGEIYVEKTYTFLTPPLAAVGLKNAGFRAFSLANNHAMDFGPQALDSTIRALDDLKIPHTGAGRNDAEARKPAWVEAAGRRIAILGYSLVYPSEFWAQADKPGCAQGDGNDMRQDIASARAQGADLVVVFMHWGQESKTKLRGYQTALARVALESGADAIVGAHPHIWQGLGVIKGKPVAYSLGNFVFGSYSAKVTRSGILYLTFDEDNRWTGGRVVPLNVHNGSVQFSPRPLPPADGRAFATYLNTLSQPLGAKLHWDGTAVQWAAPAAAK